MLSKVKARAGIHESIHVYDEEVQDLIKDAVLDMRASGVPQELIDAEDERAITAIACYVKANQGNDRSDTDKYMNLYRQKTFRLSLEGDDDVE